MNDPQKRMEKTRLDEAMRAGREGADALVRLELATALSPQAARDVALVLRLVVYSAVQALAGAEHVAEAMNRLATVDDPR